MKVRLERAAFIGKTYRRAGEEVDVGIAKDKLPEWMVPVSEQKPAPAKKPGRKPASKPAAKTPPKPAPESAEGEAKDEG